MRLLQDELSDRLLEEFSIFGVRSGPQTRVRCAHQKSGSFKIFVVYSKYHLSKPMEKVLCKKL
jgi:hypothetical protein